MGDGLVFLARAGPGWIFYVVEQEMAFVETIGSSEFNRSASEFFQQLSRVSLGSLLIDRQCRHRTHRDSPSLCLVESRSSSDLPNFVWPLPVGSFRLIDAVLKGVISARNLLVPEFLHGMATDLLQFRNVPYHVHRQAETVDLVLDGQFQRCIDVSLFLVTADVHISVIRATVGQTMNQPGISMKVEDDWLIDGEERIEIRIRQTVRMLTVRLHLEKIDYVDVTIFKSGNASRSNAMAA